MALINCPECGREISDKSNTCIHCGVILTNKVPKKKKILIILLCVLLVIICIFVINKIFFNKSELPNKLEQLLKCEQSTDIKNIFGNQYETNNHSSSKTEVYRNLKIDDFDCYSLTLLFDGNGYTGYDCELLNIDERHLNSIIQKFIEIFNNQYDCNYRNNTDIYVWKLENNRTVSLSISKNKNDELYHLHIVNVQ